MTIKNIMFKKKKFVLFQLEIMKIKYFQKY